MLIEVSNVEFGYGKRPVVRVEQLHVQAGRSLGIFGPNGSGKSTLVRGMSGLLAPMSGDVARRPSLRTGYLPQYRSIDLSWPMTALDAALMATSARRWLGWVGGQQRAARDAMRRLGVEGLAASRFSILSGGQQQRVLLAGALAASPDLLLLDEPTDGLDVHSRRTLLELLRDLKQGGLSCVIISHEIEDLMELCDEIARLHPADEADDPARVEILSPAELARQLTATAVVESAR